MKEFSEHAVITGKKFRYKSIRPFELSGKLIKHELNGATFVSIQFLNDISPSRSMAITISTFVQKNWSQVQAQKRMCREVPLKAWPFSIQLWKSARTKTETKTEMKSLYSVRIISFLHSVKDKGRFAQTYPSPHRANTLGTGTFASMVTHMYSTYVTSE